MTTFRVGMRVRIKYSRAWPELAGQEGKIVAGGVLDFGPNAGKPCWTVNPDSWPSGYAPRPGIYGSHRLGCIESQIEPITDSNTLVSWESMRDLWVPEHMSTKA